ncbi:MAG: hypothetical protein AAF393_04260 [Pseudomonadota bacterium]
MTSAEEAYAEAQRRIAAWGKGPLDLRLPDLDRLPPDISALQTLTNIDLEGTNITDDGLAPIAALKGLQILDLRRSKVTDAGLSHLSGLSGLRELYLRETGITDAGLSHLSGLSGMQTLYLSMTGITDAGLSHLSGLSGMQTLYLSMTGITDAGLSHLSGLSGMQRLYLTGTGITDAGLSHLSGLSGMQALYLNGTGITDAGLSHLSGLSGLRTLDLSMTGITDAGLSHLSGLPGMLRLDLSMTGITDAGLSHLSGLSGMRELDLTGTAVVDLRPLLDVAYLFDGDSILEGIVFQDPPKAMAQELKEILAVANRTERKTRLRDYLQSLPPLPQPLDEGDGNGALQQSEVLPVGVRNKRIDVADTDSQDLPISDAQAIAHGKVVSALFDVIGAANRHDDLSDPGLKIREFVGAAPDQVRKLELHFELRTLRGIYDRRAERDADNQLETKTVSAIQQIVEFGPYLTLDDPRVKALDQSLVNYEDPTGEALAKLDGFARAIEENADVFGPILRLISEKVQGPEDIRFKQASQQTTYNTLLVLAAIVAPQLMSPAIGQVGTEIVQAANLWLSTYGQEAIAVAGNYSVMLQEMVEKAVAAARKWKDKRGDDA